MLAHTLKLENPKLSQRGARRLLRNIRRSWRKRRPRTFSMLLQRSAGAYVNHIHDSIPLPAKLPNLLVCDFQQQRDRVFLPGGLGMHRWKVKPPARNRVEDAHQCALRVAIPDVKDLHNSCSLVAPATCRLSGGHPSRRSCTTTSIRLQTPSPKAPLPPEPWGKRSPRERNQIPAAPAPASAGSYQ